MNLAELLQSQGYVEIPLKKNSSGTLEVQVKVNGEDAVLYLDTGAGRTGFDKGCSERLRLELNEFSGKAAGLGVSNQAISSSIVEQLLIGSIRITSLKTIVVDFSHVNMARAQQGYAACDGVLGADVLVSKSAVIDYKSSKLYLRDE